MPGLSRGLAACLCLLVSPSALAVELNYKWKKGDVHRFSYADDTTFKMGMAGMSGMMMPGMGDGGLRMQVQSVFSQKVLAVRPDGSADVELTVEKLDLFQDGSKVASISRVPPAARVVKAEVDKKGNAKFYKMVTVYMQDEQMFVGVHKVQAGPHGASASGTLGNEQVEVVAAIDPKTGAITASMKSTERPPPALRKVEVKQEDPGVDVLPKQIFEMLVLPEGDMKPGSGVVVAMPFGNLQVALNAMTGNVAKLRTRLDGTKVEAVAPAEQAAEAGSESELGGADLEAPEEEGPRMGGMAMGGMNMGGMAMGGMNMGGAPGGKGKQGQTAQSMGGVKMDVDVEHGFDVAKGRLLSLGGTMSSDMDMGGMGSVQTTSRLTLKRLP